MEYSCAGPFGALDKVITYSDTQTQLARETLYFYDSHGSVIEIRNPAGDGTHGETYNEFFQYDQYGRVVAKLIGLVGVNGAIQSNPMSKITVYAYDALGRVEKIKYGYESSTWPISASALASITDYDLVYDYVVDTDLVSSVTQTTYGNEDTWYYGYDARGRLTSYKPAWPAGFGTISYTYNNAGQKTSMSVPIGVTGKGRKMIYKYDSTGKQVGMDVVPCYIADAGDCSLDIPEGPQPNARYFYDPDYNRSAMITKWTGLHKTDT